MAGKKSFKIEKMEARVAPAVLGATLGLGTTADIGDVLGSVNGTVDGVLDRVPGLLGSVNGTVNGVLDRVPGLIGGLPPLPI